jgi:hypothetical protein
MVYSMFWDYLSFFIMTFSSGDLYCLFFVHWKCWFQISGVVPLILCVKLLFSECFHRVSTYAILVCVHWICCHSIDGYSPAILSARLNSNLWAVLWAAGGNVNMDHSSHVREPLSSCYNVWNSSCFSWSIINYQRSTGLGCCSVCCTYTERN